MSRKIRYSDGQHKQYTILTASGSRIDQQELEKDALEQRLLALSDVGSAKRGRASRGFSAGVVVMLLLLAAQALYLYRDQAVAIDFVASAFKSMGYTRPNRHHPEMIGLTNRVFTDIERQAGLYRLQLGLMNHASHPQPFPLIEVSLTDAKGVIQARNRFHAREYLPPSYARSQMAPDEEHVISIDMKSSATDASGFMLDFF
ncbi:MAG TPA: hypothetical protein DDW45_08045 [Gammaproteobacteria bacterium]|nr:hypothetical protein [Gammaproteobacteria bacterium]